MLQKAKSEIAKWLAKELGVAEETLLATLDTPKDEFGDLTTRIAFVLAKERKENPVKIAAELVKQLKPNGYVEKISATGPYLNFHFSNEFYSDALAEIKKKIQNSEKEKRQERKWLWNFSMQTLTRVCISDIYEIFPQEKR